MIEHTLSNNFHEIRDAIRALCAEFPDEYFRQVDEQRESLAADAMLAVVDVKITGVDRQLSPAGWIVLEEFSQVNAFDVGVMSAQFLPG